MSAMLWEAGRRTGGLVPALRRATARGHGYRESGGIPILMSNESAP